MSKPVAGEAMALRCACVMRGMRIPLLVLFTSSSDEPFGVVVPIPAAPVEGKIFCDCSCLLINKQTIIIKIYLSVLNFVFIKNRIFGLIFFEQKLFYQDHLF